MERENTTLRTTHRKVFEWVEDGKVKRRLHLSRNRLHYTDANGVLRDIAPRWTVRNGVATVDGVPFRCTASDLGYEFVSEQGLRATVKLIAPTGDGSRLSVGPEPYLLRWSQVHPGLDIVLEAHLGGVRMQKVLYDEHAPREFASDVLLDDGLVIEERRGKLGKDNMLDTAPRYGDDPTNGRRPIDRHRGLRITQTMTELAPVDGQRHFRVRVVWNGEALRVEPRTNLTRPTTDIEYPVRILI